jgi:hypothetical protein
MSLLMVLLAAAVQFAAMLFISALAICPACWLYNKVNGLAPPGLGRSDSRDYTLVTSPDIRHYRPPRALTRYDRATTASGGVPLPGLGRSLGIAVCFTLASCAIGWLLLLVFNTAGSATGSTPQMSLLLAQLVAVPLNVVLLAGLVSLFLPTTFGRGLLVSLVYFLMLLVIGAVLAMLGGLAVYGLLTLTSIG